MVYAIIILAAALIISSISAGYLFTVKKDLKSFKSQLSDIHNDDTNARLTTATFDKDISTLAIIINDMLERQKAEILRCRNAELKMKHAVTNISHDLRTPLTSAMGYLQLMESKAAGEAKHKEYSEIVKAKLKMLVILIERLFEFSQILERKNLKLEKINVCNVLRDVLAGFYEDFVQKGFDVRLEIPEIPLYIYTDEEAVRRIFQNLAQNALTHGSRYFMASLDSETKEIEFANHVEDIKAIETEYIFDRFYTLDASRTNKNTGLGLAIVKGLVEGMGGSVSAGIKDDFLSIKLHLGKAEIEKVVL